MRRDGVGVSVVLIVISLGKGTQLEGRVGEGVLTIAGNNGGVLCACSGL